MIKSRPPAEPLSQSHSATNGTPFAVVHCTRVCAVLGALKAIRLPFGNCTYFVPAEGMNRPGETVNTAFSTPEWLCTRAS